MRKRYLVAVLSLAACGSSTAANSGADGTKPATPVTTAVSTTTTTAANAYSAGGGYAVPTTGGGGGGYAVPATSAPPTGGPQTLTIITTTLGPALGDAKGFAVYMFTPDTGGKPTCVGSCATTWPPAATTGAPVAASGIDAAKLATVTHPNGATQLVYNGHPLYHFSGDAAPGDTGGEGRGGYWYLVNPAGDKIAG
jgi:predicted lipoprotein with Yx(FWY)xxD motif